MGGEKGRGLGVGRNPGRVLCTMMVVAHVFLARGRGRGRGRGLG